MAIARLEGLGQLKNPMTSSGTEPATFRLVALVPQPTTPPRAPSLDGLAIMNEGKRRDYRKMLRAGHHKEEEEERRATYRPKEKTCSKFVIDDQGLKCGNGRTDYCGNRRLQTKKG
jgi:hypothetical protein